MPMRTLDREGALAVASGSQRRPAITTACQHGEKTTAEEGHKQESHTRSVSETRGRCSGVTREHSRRRAARLQLLRRPCLAPSNACGPNAPCASMHSTSSREGDMHIDKDLVAASATPLVLAILAEG